ncbi:MAG: TIGR04211 family SH3 domain-containing protein [Gammaproteobacteria bacterium]|nr:TIGR04211 family SH3 domain-containing protein [Gammaproteobacteria bacterium]
MKTRIIVLLSAFLISNIALAETLYVTDRILLGVHQDPAENSTVIATIPSGTAVDVLERSDDFVQIKLADGRQGWVSAAYLKADKPATAQLDAASAQLKQAQDAVKKLTDDMSKKDRELQVRQDEISNDKSTIAELQKKLKDQSTGTPAPSPQAEEEIKALQAQVKQLTEEKAALVSQEAKSTSVTSMHDLQSENQQLQARIEAALANLQGKQVPTASELASIRPSFPFWYWILLIAIFVGGVAAGLGWFDYHHRKRHGGFRV